MDSGKTPHGLREDSIWSPYGLHKDSMDTIRSPPGVHQEFIRTPSGISGVHQDSIWTPSGCVGECKLHLHSQAEYQIAGRPLQPLPCLNMIVLFALESCSHKLSIASVGHSDHVHVLIHGYVFAGILLSSIEYSVAGWPARSLLYLHIYTYVRWSSAPSPPIILML